MTTATGTVHGGSDGGGPARDVPGGDATVGGGWRAVFAYWWLTYRRTWRGSLVSGFLSPLLYLAAMGFGLGVLVDRGAGITTGGTVVPYVVFVAPGVLAATAMQTAVSETTYPVMGAIRWQRHYHAMLATPVRVGEVLAGHLAYVLVRVLITCTVFLLVAAALGTLTSWWAVLALPAAVLTGAAFAAPVFAFSAAQENDQGFNLLFRFVVTPMFLFSGTFFPVEGLPGWMHPVAWATPLWHGVQLCRGFALGDLAPLPALGHVLYLAVWLVVGLVLARRLLTARLVEP